MKTKFFLASILGLALSCHASIYGQLNSTPRRTPTGPVKTTGTATGLSVTNSKLLIYAKNGVGTTSTNTSAEFGAQLTWSAVVDGQFSLQWSRTKAGGAEKGKVYLKPMGVPGAAEGFIPNLEATLPSQSTAVNIGIKLKSRFGHSSGAILSCSPVPVLRTLLS